MKIKNIIIIFLCIIIIHTIVIKFKTTYYTLEKLTSEENTKTNDNDDNDNDDEINTDDMNNIIDEDGNIIMGDDYSTDDEIQKEKNKKYDEIKASVIGSITDENKEMPRFISDIPGYSKYSVDNNSVKNKNNTNNVSNVSNDIMKSIAANNTSNNGLNINSINTTNMNGLLSNADLSDNKETYQEIQSGSKNVNDMYSPNKTNILMKDVKNDKITSQCYKISASYSLDKGDEPDEIDDDGRNKPYIICRPECLGGNSSRSIINMSDSVSDDFDFWCKNEFGREYGLKYIDRKDCSDGMGRGVCSKHFYNGYPI